jgi:hypothetical protein
MSELFKDIPEFVEVGNIQVIADLKTNIGESVTARTETLGELFRISRLYLQLHFESLVHQIYVKSSSLRERGTKM